MSLPRLLGIVTLHRCGDPCRVPACRIREINQPAACTRVTPQSSRTAVLQTVGEQREDLPSESVGWTRAIDRYVETRGIPPLLPWFYDRPPFDFLVLSRFPFMFPHGGASIEQFHQTDC